MERRRLTTLLTATVIILALAASSFAQGEASGGRLPSRSTPKPVEPVKTPATSSPSPAKTSNARVRQSTALDRIEGQWCLGGDRNRIRRVSHDQSGRLTIITDTGAQQTGSYHYQNWPYLNSASGDIKGSVFYKSTRIDWADGTFWTWCGR